MKYRVEIEFEDPTEDVIDMHVKGVDGLNPLQHAMIDSGRWETISLTNLTAAEALA